MIYSPVIGAFISSVLLSGAMGLGYIYNLYPCHLCMIQRWMHVLCIMGCAIIIFIRPTKRISCSFISVLFLLSFSAALYHVMVEAGVLENHCSASGAVDVESLMNMPLLAPPCNQVSWYFAGLSMAAWNAIISFGSAILFASGIRK